MPVCRLSVGNLPRACIVLTGSDIGWGNKDTDNQDRSINQRSNSPGECMDTVAMKIHFDAVVHASLKLAEFSSG